MAKFRLNDLKNLHAELGGILQDYSNAKAAEAAAAGDDSGKLEQTDQPGALDSIPEYNRLSAQDSASEAAMHEFRMGLRGKKSKDLVYVAPGSGALDSIPGYNRIRNGEVTDMHAMTPADAIVCDGLPVGFRTGTMLQINRNEFHFHQPMVDLELTVDGDEIHATENEGV